MFRKPKDLDRVVHSRALDRARWAIRDHGDKAETVIKRKLARKGIGPADRILHQLTLRSIADLRRQEQQVVVRSPRPATGLITMLAGLFGGTGRKRSRRRRS